MTANLIQNYTDIISCFAFFMIKVRVLTSYNWMEQTHAMYQHDRKHSLDFIIPKYLDELVMGASFTYIFPFKVLRTVCLIE